MFCLSSKVNNLSSAFHRRGDYHIMPKRAVIFLSADALKEIAPTAFHSVETSQV